MQITYEVGAQTFLVLASSYLAPNRMSTWFLQFIYCLLYQSSQKLRHIILFNFVKVVTFRKHTRKTL